MQSRRCPRTGIQVAYSTNLRNLPEFSIQPEKFFARGLFFMKSMNLFMNLCRRVPENPKMSIFLLKTFLTSQTLAFGHQPLGFYNRLLSSPFSIARFLLRILSFIELRFY